MTFTESLATPALLLVVVGVFAYCLAYCLLFIARRQQTEQCSHEPDELTARIAAWRKRTGATEAPSFPPPFPALAEDEIAPPPCFRCLSDETPVESPAIARNEPSGVQWADTPAYRGVERRQQSRGSLRPVWTPAQRRLVEDDRTGTVGRYLESEGEEE